MKTFKQYIKEADTDVNYDFYKQYDYFISGQFDDIDALLKKYGFRKTGDSKKIISYESSKLNCSVDINYDYSLYNSELMRDFYSDKSETPYVINSINIMSVSNKYLDNIFQSFDVRVERKIKDDLNRHQKLSNNSFNQLMSSITINSAAGKKSGDRNGLLLIKTLEQSIKTLEQKAK